MPPQKPKVRGPAAYKSPRAYTDAIFRRLAKHFGPYSCPLHYNAPHELAIAVILSAQCTDERVNLTTPALFAEYPTVDALADAPLKRIEKLVYSTGFYKNKARGIQGFCRALREDHNYVVPKDALLLEKMPGVGRKTANVVVQELYGIPSGVVVDTHVARISLLLGLTTSRDAKRSERELMAVLREKHWIGWSLYLIYLGRSACTARKRECSQCVLEGLCPSAHT